MSTPSFTRQDVSIPSGSGYLRGLALPSYRGDRATGGHPTTDWSDAGDAPGRFAERFAEAGIAALAFTYRHFGDSTSQPGSSCRSADNSPTGMPSSPM